MWRFVGCSSMMLLDLRSEMSSGRTKSY
jgi:hypothetical protein